MQFVPAAENLVGLPGLIPEQDTTSGGARYKSKFQNVDGGVMSCKKVDGVLGEGQCSIMYMYIYVYVYIHIYIYI